MNAPNKLMLQKITLLVGIVAMLLTLAVGPAFATESTPEGGGEDTGKIELPKTEHDRVGLIILGFVGLGAVGALANARKQLKGERDQATGQWRWR